MLSRGGIPAGIIRTVFCCRNLYTILIRMKRYLYVFKTEVSKIRRNQKEGVKREMWNIKLRYRKQWSSFEIIILGFAGVILAGALLLMLPVASREGNVTPFTETLFTATSAVCVTGLAVRDTE